MSMYEEKPAGEPAEPGAPPPADDVAVPEYSGDAEGMASSSWWDSMSLTVFGKQVTNEQAKTIIYVGALALVVVTVALVVTVSGGGGAAGGGGGGGGGGGPRVVGGWDGAEPQWDPRFSATAGRNSGQGVVVATTDRGPRNPIRMGFGSQCKMASAPFGDCSGAAGARCGITPNGEVYAWIMASVADCVGSPTCAPIEGRPVRYGCSRAELGDSFVECCVAIETQDTTDCSDCVDVTTDFASTRCVSTVANTDTAAGRTAELASGGRAYAVSCVRSCENTYAKHSCDHCSCVFGCQAATSGQSFSSCMTNACANPANPPVGLDGGRCDLKSPGCVFAGDACNAGCNIPYNADAVTPPALKFEFDGNLLDTSGSNHGRSHFNPPGSEVWADGRPGSSGSGQSLVFDNDDYVTLRSPFPAEDTEFSLAVWLAPREIVFDGWHAFVGYQNGGVCPGRSPSMWVDGGGHGDNEDGVWKGLHYDSCEQETSTRFAGVLENFFTTPDEFVHVAWVKQGPSYFFYRNGVPVQKPGGGDYEAPPRVQLSDLYNIGHNDNYFDGKIDEVAFFDYALTATEVSALFSGQTNVAFTATSNVGSLSFGAQTAGYGEECNLFWNDGGCGGVDNGRCGVTADGAVYAWYLDAVAWCDDINPFCGFVMGLPVKNVGECSRAERVGYFVECCVAEATAETRPCADQIDISSDATASCAQSLSSQNRNSHECDEQCDANGNVAGTQEGCACRAGCMAAVAGANFEACTAGCFSRTEPTSGQCSTTGGGRTDWCAIPAQCTDACTVGCSIPYRQVPQPAAVVGMDSGLTFTAKDSDGNTWSDTRVTLGTECSLSSTATQCTAGSSLGEGPKGKRCGVTDGGEVYAWLLDSHCSDDQPECTFSVGPSVREGCSRAQRAGRWVECCHRLGGETASTVDCGATEATAPVSWRTDPTAVCSHSANQRVCDRVTDNTVKVDGQPAGILEAPDKICKDDGEACEIFTATHGATCSMKCAEAGLVCQDGWDDNPDPNNGDQCMHHLIGGTDVNEQQLDSVGAHNYGVGGCENPYGNQICRCRATNVCQVDMEYPYDWLDISSVGTAITDWHQNGDDGWKHIDIGFAFNWFGDVEHTVTVSTNGYLSFGTQGLRNGAAEPVPCHWDASTATGAGCVGSDGTTTNYGSGHEGNGVDGVIAVFWADLTTDAPNSNTQVFHHVHHPEAGRENMIAWNKLYVQWDRMRVWNAGDADLTFQAILFGDGTVLLQYKDMPTGSTGSWTQESVGFEDATGEHGVQISYGAIPAAQSAYQIPASCHVAHDNGRCVPTRFEKNPLYLPWASAEDHCVRKGGHLMSIHSEHDQRAFEILAGSDEDARQAGHTQSDGRTSNRFGNWDGDAVWIGFHDIHSEGGCNGDAFVWSDGTHADYTAWSDGEPNDWTTVDGVGQSNCAGHGGEDCTSGPPSRDWKWNDQACSFEHQSICGFCGGGTCEPTHFTYTETPRTQMAAEDDCVQRGGHLASAHGQHDTDVWQSLVPARTSAWIGLHDRDAEGGCDRTQFRWTDGTDTDYQNWIDGEPNDWICPNMEQQGTNPYNSERPDGCVNNCDASGNGQEDCVSVIGGESTPGVGGVKGTWHPELGRNGVWVHDADFTGQDWKWNDDMCDVEQPYICGFCTGAKRPTDYLYVPHVDSEPLNQHASEAACTRLGGHLASFHSQSDMDKALALMQAGPGDSLGLDMVATQAVPDGERAWIGLHDRGASEAGCDRAGFLWSDGTINDFDGWANGEPNDWKCDGVESQDDIATSPCGFESLCDPILDDGCVPCSTNQCCVQNIEAGGNCGSHCDATMGAEDCVDMREAWNDVPCSGRSGDGHLCGFAPGGECLPTNYVFYPQRLTQQRAEDYCVSQGGHLASAHSQADQDTFVQLAENHRALPPTMRYLFEGNLFSTDGVNHGESHFLDEQDQPLPPELFNNNRGAPFVPVRQGAAAGHGQALHFDGNDYVTVQSPFPHEATDFSIVVWLAPSVIEFNGWHAFIGYQDGGVCPGRSPSMWVRGDGGAGRVDGVDNLECNGNCGGLHYDSCDDSTSTRYAGVINNFFTDPERWVQVAWVKAGRVYKFYKDGLPIGDDREAPVNVQLSEYYNIGHNDNYFEGDISEVSFYDFSVSADDVATMYGAGASGQDGQGHHATGDHPVEIWIGFHDRDTEAGCTGESFVWTDATPTHFQAWSAGEPNDWLCSANGESQNGLDQNGAGQTCGSDCDGAGNGELATSGTVQHEDCTALLKGRDWGWNDYHCDLQLQFICGFCTASCAPTGFQYFETPMTMPAAEAYCVEQGGHLASVHSVDDVFTLMSLVPSGSTRDFWIGLHDRDELGAVEGGCSGETFIWTDGTDNDFSNFSPGEPNDWSDGQAHCTTGCDGYWSPSGGGCQDDAVGVSGGTGGEDCVMIDPNRIAWGEDDTGPTSRYGAHPIAGRDGTMQMNDGVCESEKPFACGFCNSARGAVANPSRYVYYPEELPWAVAQYNCLALGGSLASLHSPEDQAAVLALMPRGGTCNNVGTGQYEGQQVGWTGQCTAWIGFHDRGQEGGCEGSQFFWSDGTSTDYQHWGQGEPNDWNAQEQSTCGGGANGEDCVIMFEECPEGQCAGSDGSSNEGERGFWNDALCDVAHPYVCGFI